MAKKTVDFGMDLVSAFAKEGLVIPTTWDKYTNQRIKELHPLTRWSFASAVKELEDDYGIYVRLTDWLRTFAEQDILFGYSREDHELAAKGLDPNLAQPSKPWKTNAIGGQSYHNYGLAGDICEIKKGKALYDTADWKTISKVFKKYGFAWMYDIMKKDKPHFQMTFGYTYRELLQMHKQKKFDENGYLILQVK